MPQSQNELDLRVFMAAERTFLAWIRTGLALMGFGFVVARFGLLLRELRLLPLQENASEQVVPGGVSLWVGDGLVLLGVLVTLLSTVEYWRTVRRVNAIYHSSERPSLLGVIAAILLAGLGVAMTLYLPASY
jgi:putative membrane protein